MPNNIVIFVAITLAAVAVIFGITKAIKLSLQTLMLGVFGATTGLIMGGLLSVPLSKLPTPYGQVLPIALAAVITVAMISFFINQRDVITELLPFLHESRHKRGAKAAAASPAPAVTGTAQQILVDTSVIIDGRIADIAQTGFIRGKLLVPRFVLAELQNIADSDDNLRRGRGRRGLEMLNNIKSNSGVEFEVIEMDAPEIKEVDHKLVHLAKQLGTDILTTDYNLNRVATVEGVQVLNINELANAIRPVVLPGEDMQVKIVQAGKEKHQGVAYLPDGTMIVVENGDKLIGKEVKVEVTRVFQTVAGKMIFAALMNGDKKDLPTGKQDHRHGRGGHRNTRPSKVSEASDR